MKPEEQEAIRRTQVPRVTGLLVIEVRDSNPNGDPDNAGFPRQRPDGRGEISPVSIKRKLRELVADKEGLVWTEMKRRISFGDGADMNYGILESRGRDRKEIIAKMKDGRFEAEYWDGRLFGSTFLESRESIDKETKTKLSDDEWQKLLKTIRTGVAHFGVGVSVAPVNVRFETWTNKAGVEEGLDRGFAPQALKFVEHGIYTVPFFVNPTQANKTKCSSADVDLMFQLLKHTFCDNQSTGRTQVEIVHAHTLKHKDQLGSFSDFALLDALKPYRIPEDDKEKPSESRKHYHIPIWDDINDKPVRAGKTAKWSDVGDYADYAL